MIKRIKSSYISALVFLSLGVLAFAVVPGLLGQGDAKVYKLTFTKFELQDDAGTWHVVNDTPATVDIASVAPGALAQAIAGAAASVPAGHYKAFRSTVSGTMTLKGYWVDAANTRVYYTTATIKPVAAPPGSPPGTVDGFGIVPGVFNGTEAQFLAALPGDYAEGTIRPPTVTDTFIGAQDTVDITVVAGANSPVAEELEVDVTNTIQVWDFVGPDGVGDVIFPGQPSITVPL